MSSEARPRSRLSLIVAMDRNRVIGLHGKVPWHLPADLKRFRALTMGHHILMGRKTWESLPGQLPGRTPVVISRSPDFTAPGCIVAHSLDEAVAACQGDAEAFFIGGAELYRQALAYADRLYLTEIAAEFEGDAWFPEFDPKLWQEVERVAGRSASGLAFDFVIYDKKQ